MKVWHKVAILVAAVGGVIFLFVHFTEFKVNKVYDWSLSYKRWDKNPYGCFVMYELLKEYDLDRQLTVIEDSITFQGIGNKSGEADIYMFIGESMYLYYEDVDTLMKFVEDGNIAFIAAHELPYYITDELFRRYPYFRSNTDTSIDLNFVHPKLQIDTNYTLTYAEGHKAVPFKWNMVNISRMLNKENIVRMGMTDDQRTVYMKIPHGDGWFYLHSVPLAFTNWSLLEQKGLEYAESVFSNLPKGDIYWDYYSKVPFNPWYGSEEEGGDSPKESPLQFILSKPSLTWAYAILASMLIAYILFMSKRKQRIIPPVDPNENTSLAFVDTVSKLYQQQGQHRSLILQKEKVFLDFVRDKYYMGIAMDDPQFTETLSKKSLISTTDIEGILSAFRFARVNYSVSDQYLIDLHKKIEDFYKNCQ